MRLEDASVGSVRHDEDGGLGPNGVGAALLLVVLGQRQPFPLEFDHGQRHVPLIHDDVGPTIDVVAGASFKHMVPQPDFEPQLVPQVPHGGEDRLQSRVGPRFEIGFCWSRRCYDH